jgi:hypothetical protein
MTTSVQICGTVNLMMGIGELQEISNISFREKRE